MKTNELLRSLGLSKYEADVYSALLQVDKAKVQDLSRVVAVPRPQIYVALGKLMDKGLCAEHRGKVSYYSAVSPSLAFGDMLKKEREALDFKAKGIEQMAEKYAQKERGEVPAEFVQVLKGRQMKEFIDRMVEEAQEEVLTFFKAAQARSPKSLEAVAALEAGLLRRGVRVRCLYERAALRHDGILPLLRKLAKQGEQGRVIGTIPMNMLMFDQAAAMFTLTTERGDVTAFVFTHPALVATLRASYEFYWQQGENLGSVLDRLESDAGSATADREE